MELSSAICSDCTGEALRAAKLELSRKQLIAVVGGSHANRLVDALVAAEAQVCAVATPGWKVTRKSVEEVMLTLKSIPCARHCGNTVPGQLVLLRM